MECLENKTIATSVNNTATSVNKKLWITNKARKQEEKRVGHESNSN